MGLQRIFEAGLTLIVPSSASSRGKLLSHAKNLPMVLMTGPGDGFARYV